MNKVADLVIVNLLTILCCIPIVTIGAAYTAMYQVLLKLYKNELSGIGKEFFRAFRQNMKVATILWIIYLLFVIIIVIDFVLIQVVNTQFNYFFALSLFVVIALILTSASWCFALLSRYKNSILTTLLNSFVVGITHLLLTIAILVLALTPLLAMILYLPSILIVLMCGVSLTGYLQIILFNKVFIQIESKNSVGNTGLHFSDKEEIKNWSNISD